MLSRHILSICLCVFWSLGLLQAQQIKGIVLERGTSLPIAGVTVTKVSTGHQVVTDLSGEFAIAIDNFPDFLEFSSMGFESILVEILDHSFQEIELYPSSQEIDEVDVVYTGYQRLKPNEINGSVSVLTEAQINRQSGTDILSRLQDMIPGFHIDQTLKGSHNRKLNISIRGLSTIQGQMDPLIVLDNFIYEGNISNIDPYSIENITVLKDATASSIWGARAGNGVIVITTKKGQNLGKETVSFRNVFTTAQKSNLHDLYRISSGDYLEIETWLFNQGYYERDINANPQYANTPFINTLIERKNGLITDEQVLGEMNRLKKIDFRDEYSKYFLRTPTINQSSLHISGGSTKYSYGIGVSLTNDISETADNLSKWNLNLSNRYSPFSFLDIDLSVYHTNERFDLGNPTYESMTVARGRYVPYMELVDDKGNPVNWETTYRKSFTDLFYPGLLNSWDYIPITNPNYVHHQRNTSESFATLNTRFRLFDFLAFNFAYQFQKQNVINDDLKSAESYEARVMVNQYAHYDSQTDRMIFPIPKGGIRSIGHQNTTSNTLRGQFDIDKAWGSNRLAGIGGMELRQYCFESVSTMLYGFSGDPLKSIPVDFSTSFPMSINNSWGRINGNPELNDRINRFVSYFGNISYTLLDKYSITGSARRDGANVFGAQTNERWKPLWSVGTSWLISEELFMKNLDWLNSFRMRMTYGYSGNVDLAKMPLPVASVQGQSYTDFTALSIGVLNDPYLRWEKVGMTNFGIDFSLFSNRIMGNADAYLKKAVDLYGATTYDYTAWGGLPFITRNTASMQGRGIDLSIKSRNIDTGISWTTEIVLSMNKNKTLSYYSPSTLDVTSFLGSGMGITPVPGLPLNAISVYRYAGLNEYGDPLGYVEGQPSDNYSAIRREAAEKGVDGNMYFVGSAKPQWFGAIQNQFQWRDISLSFSISFQGDYYFLQNTTKSSEVILGGLAYGDFNLRWQNPGDERSTQVPSLRYPANTQRDSFYGFSDINIRKGDFLKLRWVNLEWARSFRLKGRERFFALNVHCSNIGILWTANKEGHDPEFLDRIGLPFNVSTGVKINL